LVCFPRFVTMLFGHLYSGEVSCDAPESGLVTWRAVGDSGVSGAAQRSASGRCRGHMAVVRGPGPASAFPGWENAFFACQALEVGEESGA
jgi:hypothetical protein